MDRRSISSVTWHYHSVVLAGGRCHAILWLSDMGFTKPQRFVFNFLFYGLDLPAERGF